MAGDGRRGEGFGASLSGRAQVLDFFVRGTVRFEVVYVNWYIDAGCLTGGGVSENTLEESAEEIRRGPERDAEWKYDYLRICCEYLRSDMKIDL